MKKIKNKGAEKMIDCSKTVNYLSERKRMTKYSAGGRCGIDCFECPLFFTNNNVPEPISCSNFEMLYPLQAISKVQTWSDTHQPKTYLSEFLRYYPNATLNRYGLPNWICPHHLGLKDIAGCKKCKHTCAECWNQVID